MAPAATYQDPKRVFSRKEAPAATYQQQKPIYFINKNAPYPNEIESFENKDWPRDQLEYHKLKATD